MLFSVARTHVRGAATFGFVKLQQTTMCWKICSIVQDAMKWYFTDDILNLFLEAKDIAQQQLMHIKTAQEPDEETFNYIFRRSCVS